MSSYGCVCEQCGEAYGADRWGAPFWCEVCRFGQPSEFSKLLAQARCAA